MNADPDPDPATQINADTDPDTDPDPKPCCPARWVRPKVGSFDTVKGGKSKHLKIFIVIYKLFCDGFSAFFAEIMVPKILLLVSRPNDRF